MKNYKTNKKNNAKTTKGTSPATKKTSLGITNSSSRKNSTYIRPQSK